MSWTAILLLAAGAYAAKFAGLVIGPRLTILKRLDPWLALLPAAMLAALVTVQTLDGAKLLTIDARAAGVAAGSVAALKRVPFVGVIFVAAVVAALVRNY